MKNFKRLFSLLSFCIVALSLMGACSAGKEKIAGADSAEAQPAAGGEFKPFDVDKDWDINPFTWFKGSGLLLAVGDQEKSNAMTIGWGALGNLWGNIGMNTVTVYVAEGRYTFEFMEKKNYFTVMAFDGEKGEKILAYMGTHTGRNEDKAAALGLHTLYTDNGTPYYQEASMVLECEIIYRAPFEKDGMCEKTREFYENFPAGVHHMYIGNIVNAWKKE